MVIALGRVGREEGEVGKWLTELEPGMRWMWISLFTPHSSSLTLSSLTVTHLTHYTHALRSSKRSKALSCSLT